MSMSIAISMLYFGWILWYGYLLGCLICIMICLCILILFALKKSTPVTTHGRSTSNYKSWSRSGPAIAVSRPLNSQLLMGRLGLFPFQGGHPILWFHEPCQQKKNSMISSPTSLPWSTSLWLVSLSRGKHKESVLDSRSSRVNKESYAWLKINLMDYYPCIY